MTYYFPGPKTDLTKDLRPLLPKMAHPVYLKQNTTTARPSNWEGDEPWMNVKFGPKKQTRKSVPVVPHPKPMDAFLQVDYGASYYKR